MLPTERPGGTPGRDWASLPPENVYELRVTLAGEPVEVIPLSKAEYSDLKQMTGEIRREHWIRLAPTLTITILGKRAISVLVGASAAMVWLKWHGLLTVNWWAALAPFAVVVAARLASAFLREQIETAVKSGMEWVKQ